MEIEEETALNSSNIESTSFDDRAKTLTIVFRAGGKYEYYNVPDMVSYELKQAASAGKYFHKFIRNNYSYKQVG